MALPKLSNAKKVAKTRIKNLGKRISKTVSPMNVASKTFSLVKNSLASELGPGVSLFADSIGKTFKDLDKEEQKGKFKPVGPSNDNSNGSAPSAVMDGVLSVLSSMNEKLASIDFELRTLVSIAAQSAGISQEQLELTKRVRQAVVDSQKSSKFRKQIDDSKFKPSFTGLKLVEPKEEGGFLAKLLNLFAIRALIGIVGMVAGAFGGLMAAIAPIGAAFAGLVAGVIGITGLLKNVKLPNWMNRADKNMPKQGSPANQNAKPKPGKSTSKFNRVSGASKANKMNLLNKAGNAAKGAASVGGRIVGATVSAAAPILLAGGIAAGTQPEATKSGIGTYADAREAGDNMAMAGIKGFTEFGKGVQENFYRPLGEKLRKGVNNLFNASDAQKKLTPNTGMNNAKQIIGSQKVIDTHDTVSKSAMINQGGNNNTINAPVTNNVSTTNVIPSNIVTRNPEGFNLASGIISF